MKKRSRRTYQSGPVKPVSFVMNHATHRLLFEAAHEERVTMSEFVRRAVDERAERILAGR